MHVITGEIRKEPRVKAGANGTLYIVELSERYKDRDQQWQYTNYTFFFNAKSDGLNGWYQEAFQVGKVISVSCETLRIESREYEGKVYNTLQAGGFANLILASAAGSSKRHSKANHASSSHHSHGRAQSRRLILMMIYRSKNKGANWPLFLFHRT